MNRDDWPYFEGRDRPYRDRRLDYPVEPPEPVRVSRADVEGLLASAELTACLDPLVGRHRGTVRVRIDREGAVGVEATVTPASEDGETCLRRTAEAVLVWSGPIRVGRVIRTSIRVRSAGAEPDAAPSLAAAIDAVRPALAACVASDVSGRVTLTVRARRSGHVRLVSARLGVFVPDAEASACLEGVVAALRVPPSSDEEAFEIAIGGAEAPVGP